MIKSRWIILYGRLFYYTFVEDLIGHLDAVDAITEAQVPTCSEGPSLGDMTVQHLGPLMHMTLPLALYTVLFSYSQVLRRF